MRHLSDAIDQIRRSEYKRVSEKERRFIKGQRYTLLSHKSNLDMVSLGFMEGLNNKSRIIQRRVYGIKDQEYLMLKFITSCIKEPKPS